MDFCHEEGQVQPNRGSIALQREHCHLSIFLQHCYSDIIHA